MIDLTATIQTWNDNHKTHMDLYYKGARSVDRSLITRCVLLDISRSPEKVDLDALSGLQHVEKGNSIIFKTGWAVLAELEVATRGLPMPASRTDDSPADGPDYGLHFTDKPLDDLGRLNFYELQHALYAARRAHDHTEGPQKETNRKRILAIYDEYRHRGINRFSTPEV